MKSLEVHNNMIKLLNLRGHIFVVTHIKKFLGGWLIFIIFILFMSLFLFAEEIKNISIFNRIPNSFFNVNTIFLSIILEAIPFILIGVFVSAIIQSFVSVNAIRRLLHRNAYLAVIPAALLGIIFPICECAIIPVVRRLIKKGMPYMLELFLCLVLLL